VALVTVQPILPVWVLLCVTAAILIARVVALRQLSPRVTRWRWAGLTLAMLLLLVAAVRPVVGPADQTVTRVADRLVPNVFLIVDRSSDMRVADYPDGQTRMAHARADLVALIGRFSDARIALISFGSRSTLQWPLSADTWSLRSSVAAVEPYATAPDQTNAGAAGNMLRYLLIGARQQYPQARNLVYYLGAGAAEARDPAREFNLPERAVDGGAVLGYGTPDGGPIPGTDVSRSVLGEPTLRTIAAQIGVPYTARTDGVPLASVVADGSTDPRSAPGGPAASAQRTELYWIPATLAAVLVLIELYLALRDFRRTRPVHRDVIV
jgi:Ca-activated chloride channel family protein